MRQGYSLIVPVSGRNAVGQTISPLVNAPLFAIGLLSLAQLCTTYDADLSENQSGITGSEYERTRIHAL